MREHLFKAICKLNGEWVKGIYCPYNWYMFHEREENPQIIIISDNKKIDGAWCEVFPETVCEYTGKNDRKGNKIFNSDRVRFYDEDGEYYDYIIKWDDEKCRYIKVDKNGYYDGLDTFLAENCEVIGNVNDCEVIANEHDLPKDVR